MSNTVYAFLMGLPALFFVYTAFKLDDRHAVMRMFLICWGWLFLLPLPVIGMELAESAGFSGIQKVMSISLIPMIFGFIFWVFYLIVLYLQDSTKAVNEPSEDFDNGM